MFSFHNHILEIINVKRFLTSFFYFFGFHFVALLVSVFKGQLSISDKTINHSFSDADVLFFLVQKEEEKTQNAVELG
jgi:hypothetical protein